MPDLIDRICVGKRKVGGRFVSTWISEKGIDRELTAAEAMELERIGYTNWYDWSMAKWGCKWNAARTEVDDSQIESGYVEIRYETPWCPPVPVLLELQKLYPDVEFSFRYRTDDDHAFPHELKDVNSARLSRQLENMDTD